MASASTSALLYATVVSSQGQGLVPEDAKELRHHVKNGKGFINPWESYRERSAWEIIKAMLWSVVRRLSSGSPADKLQGVG